MATVDTARVRVLREGEYGAGPVVYVMARDHRADDNWALLFARSLAAERDCGLVVACPVAADYPDAPRRQIDFLAAGLAEVDARLAEMHIPFVVADRDAAMRVAGLSNALGAAALVFDFNPLRESQEWKRTVVERVSIQVFEVDAHNVVPCWEVSDKQEYAAYTIRPRINRLLAQYLGDYPALERAPERAELGALPDGWSRLDSFTARRDSAALIVGLASGPSAADAVLQRFFKARLAVYDSARNDPTLPGQSGLSPYLHFGQISAQRVALAAMRQDDHVASQESFVEELIVRRELSDNFCFHNDRYDSFAGFPQWAQTTLEAHRGDPRPYLYDREQLEAAQTHDKLWNAAQREMMRTGKMHGYMRMYWAKKILEWSVSPEAALAVAIGLNNRYELDGCDPNGYAGIAWSIGGVHDRAWPEREVFGKIRYMSYDGCRRKFAVKEYVAQYAPDESGRLL